MAAPEMAAAGMRTLCLCRRRRRTGRQAGLGAVPADDARGVVTAHGASARSLGNQLVVRQGHPEPLRPRHIALAIPGIGMVIDPQLE